MILALFAGCADPHRDDEHGRLVGDAADQLEQAGDQLKQTSRDFAPARASDYTHLDVAWYAVASAQLKRVYYTELGDLRDVEHDRKNPQARTFVRVLLGPDGATMAGLWHYWDLRPDLQGLPTNDVRAIDLETEFTDGSFVITSSMPPQADFDMGPMIDRRIVTTRDPVVHARLHLEHLAEYRKRYPRLEPVKLFTLEDVIRSQQRQQRVKGIYRQEMGIPFTEDELNNATDNRVQRVVRIVSDELRSRFPSW